MSKPFKFSPLSKEPYTRDEMETLKKIVEFNNLIEESIKKIGTDATGAALCFAFLRMSLND